MAEGKLRLGRVSYKNTLPLFYKWNLPFVEIKEGTPSQLAAMLDIGLLDGGILSSLFYIQNRGRFSILPDISISSFGEVRSVLLFSKKPLKEIKSVRPSPESLTSNFLTYAVLRKFFGLKVEFVKALRADAELVIGDRALKLSSKSEVPFVYDIGKLWFEKTGLPALFALFIVPTDWLRERPKEVAFLALTLMESKKNFFQNLESLNLEPDLKSYLKNLNYDFGEEHLKSLTLMEKLFSEYLLGKF